MSRGYKYVEQYIKKIKALDTEIHYIDQELKELSIKEHDCITEQLVPVMGDVQTQSTNAISNPTLRKVETIIDTLSKESEELIIKRRSKVIEKTGIKDVIDGAGLTSDELIYVTERYIKGRAVWKIAKQMNYSEESTRLIKISALNKIDSLLNFGEHLG